MRRFFLAVLARETSLDEAERVRLADALARPIGRLLVYHDPADMPALQVPAANLAAGAEPPSPTPTPAFDPFAFSVIATLKRSGRAALLDRLAGIDDPEHLLRLASAQHLAIAPADDTPDALRAAIVAGAEARLADRRAAAS